MQFESVQKLMVSVILRARVNALHCTVLLLSSYEDIRTCQSHKGLEIVVALILTGTAYLCNLI